MRISYRLRISAGLLLLFLVGMGAQNKCGYHAPPEYQKIFDLPRDQQKEAFKNLPLDSQVDMYIYSMYREPPSEIFRDYLASNGKIVIPHILERLAAETRDHAKAVLIQVFSTMHDKYYNLKNETQVINTLKLESAKISDAEYREESERDIKDILEHPGYSVSSGASVSWRERSIGDDYADQLVDRNGLWPAARQLPCRTKLRFRAETNQGSF